MCKSQTEDTSRTVNGDGDRIQDIVWLMRKLMQGEELYTKELNKAYQVSAPQLNCLLALREYGPLPPSHIAKAIMVDSSTITGIIDRLERKGLVERSRTSPDRRVIIVSLTEGGRDLATHAPPPFQKKIVEGLRRMPDHEVEKIIKALMKLVYMLDVQNLDVE
ncbi:MAG: MarR family transcriptional regulator [Deltaproteobacteria bacterium]|nr:MarR family transcriptional regulator [Deltaproteobacteria bacterium]